MGKVIYNGKEYATVKRQAKVGDLVQIVADTFTDDPHGFDIGYIGRVTDIIPRTDFPFAKTFEEEEGVRWPDRVRVDGRYITNNDYIVLEPVNTKEDDENQNRDIPVEWIGKKARVLYDKPLATPYSKGDIVKIVPADNDVALIFGKQAMLQREGERTYSLPKYMIELIEDDNIQLTPGKKSKGKKFKIGDKVRITDGGFALGCKIGDTGVLVYPDLLAIMLGIEFLVKLDRTGEIKAVEPSALEKIKDLKEGSLVKMLQDDSWGAYSKGQKFSVIQQGDFLGIIDNDGEFRALEHLEYELL